MNEKIITVHTPYGTRYELQDFCGNRHQIIKPESNCPYIVMDGERLNLLPKHRKALLNAMEAQ